MSFCEFSLGKQLLSVNLSSAKIHNDSWISPSSDFSTIKKEIVKKSQLLLAKDDNSFEVSFQPTNILAQRNILVVIDLNGFLYHRIFKCQHFSETELSSKVPCYRLGNFYVYPRPHYKSFLQFLFANFHVGLWSSAKKHNILRLINDENCGFPKTFLDMLTFIFDQSHCTAIPVPNSKKPLFLKDLSIVWEKFPQWNASNTLIIDDSVEKLQRNPKYTSISPPTWTRNDVKDESLGINGSVRKFLTHLLDAGKVNVPEFVETHPFTAL
jgi:hypothetical protein